MSRLYVTVISDMLKNDRTARADEICDVQVRYGSKDKSMKLVSIWVKWPKGTEKPIVEGIISADADFRGIQIATQ